MTSNRK